MKFSVFAGVFGLALILVSFLLWDVGPAGSLAGMGVGVLVVITGRWARRIEQRQGP